MKFRSILTFITILGACHSAFAQNGFASMFDGENLKGWRVVGAAAHFNAANGIIEGTVKVHNGGSFLITEKQYSNFILELDVKNEGMANSGIQVRSFLKDGTDTVAGKQCEVDPSDRLWSGGIFDSGRRGWLYPGDMNGKAKSAYKKGQFNHFKIEYIGNEMRTWVNGIPVADLIDTVDQTGFIGLQVHGWDKSENSGRHVWFKNIRIKTKGLMPAPYQPGIYVMNFQPNTLAPQEKRDGWKLLFDGKTLAGWQSPLKMGTFPEKGWNISNGMMTVDPQRKDVPSGGDIITDKKYKAFDLSFEFKTTAVANSGVKYFVYLDEKNEPLGLEYQVLDDDRHPDAKLGRNGDRTEASLYDLIPSKRMLGNYRPVGQWNTGRIIVYPNNHVEHYLNGIKVLEYDRLSPQFAALIAISKYKDYKGFGILPDGYILLQDHGCVVNFRSIKLKEL